MESKKYIIIEEEVFNGMVAAAGSGTQAADTDEDRLKFIGQVSILLNNIKVQHLKTKEEALEIIESAD